MKTQSAVAAALALTLFGASGWSMAASPSRGTDGTKLGSQDPMHSMMMDHMMDGGDGMMDGYPMMGQLPPGNEKLSMQMHGEMMQAMGEILRRHADNIQTPLSKWRWPAVSRTTKYHRNTVMKCNTRTMAAVDAILVTVLAVAYTVFPSVRASVLGIGPYLLILVYPLSMWLMMEDM